MKTKTCEYCKVAENGDIESKDLIFGVVNHRIKEKAINDHVAMKVDIDLTLPIYSCVMVSANEQKMSLLLYTWDYKMDVQKDVKINYCPMCGRKLGDENE